MLVLTRKERQCILIGDDIRVIVVKISPGLNGESPKVMLGIEAPRDLAVDREEIRDRKNAAKEQ